MWQVYFSIAVVFGGGYCLPANRYTNISPCTVVIKRFGEPVTSLEVAWNSTIHLICDASCVGPGPQPSLTWLYKNKTSKKKINIEKLFRSPKFETYPTYSHRKNELRIRDFGPSEETMFICEGSIKGKLQKAVVRLIGTDCLLKYKFRCQSDKSCIDRGNLCNRNRECPDGEDEVGCGYDTDITTAGSSKIMRETTVEVKQTSEEDLGLICPVGKKACEDRSHCIEDSQRCNRVQDCQDGGDEVGCDFGDDTDITTAGSSKITQETTVEVKQTSEEGRPCEYRCGDGTCIASSMQCNGYPDCPDGSDEICGIRSDCALDESVSAAQECSYQRLCSILYRGCVHGRDGMGIGACRQGGFGLICSEGKKACNDSSICIDDSQRCNRVQDCQDGGDEVGCDFGNLSTDTEPPATKTAQEEEDDDYDYDYAKEVKDTKTLIRGTEINVDANMNAIPATDAVTAKTGEFTRTTPFDYLFYIDYFQQSDQS